MSEAPKKAVDPMRHILAIALLAGGVVILAAVGAFLWLAIGFRQSFTASLPPTEDMILGLAALSPLVLFALVMIGYGRRMLRREPPKE